MMIQNLSKSGGASGGLVIKATTHAAVTKGYPYHLLMDSSGYLTQAITAAAGSVVIALKSAASGDECEFMLEGVCDVYTAAACTAGHGVIPDVSDGYCKTAGSAMAGIVGQEAMTHLGVFLVTRTAAGTDKCLINGISMTCTA